MTWSVRRTPGWLLICLVLCVIYGQSDAKEAPSSLGRALQEGMASVLQVESWPCLYTGTFDQLRSLPGNSMVIKSSGLFLFDCQHGLLWETILPVASTQVYSNGGKRFAVNSTGVTKPLSGRLQGRIATLLLSLMGGDASALEQDFTHSAQSTESQTIELLPRRAALARHLQQISITHLQDGINIRIATPTAATTDLRLRQMRTQTLPAVAVCARQSPLAAVTCPLLFDAAAEKR